MSSVKEIFLLPCALVFLGCNSYNYVHQPQIHLVANQQEEINNYLSEDVSSQLNIGQIGGTVYIQSRVFVIKSSYSSANGNRCNLLESASSGDLTSMRVCKKPKEQQWFPLNSIGNKSEF